MAARARPGRAAAVGLAVALGLAGWAGGAAASELLLAVATAPLAVPQPPLPRPGAEPAHAGAPAEAADPASDLAVMRAPLPKVKPASLARQHAGATAHRVAGPASIRQAAGQHGLSLTGTSLIGVLDAGSGRQALIRTPGGDYRKVGRGDSIDGWRVTAVNQDSVRLSRGAETRTLPLVVR